LILIVIFFVSSISVNAATIIGGTTKNPWVDGNAYYDHRTVDDAQKSPLPASGTIHYYAPGVMEQVWAYRSGSEGYQKCDNCVGYAALMRDGDKKGKVCIQRSGKDKVEGPFHVIDVANDNDKKTLIEKKNWVVDVDYNTAVAFGMLAGPINATILDCPATMTPYLEGKVGDGAGNTVSATASTSTSGSGNSSGTGTTNSSTPKFVPAQYKAINSGRGTISCKLGVSTSGYPEVLDPTILLRIYERQLNTGWLVAYADSVADIEGFGVPALTMATLGQNAVILPCKSKDSCQILDGEEYATTLWEFAKAIGKPIWAYAGHHEVNVNNQYDIGEEIEFIKTMTATLNNLMYAEGIEDGTGYRYRGLINLISPELAFDSEEGAISMTPEAYLEELRANEIDLGEFKGLGFQAYTPEHMAKAVELAQKYKIQAYITAGMKLDSLTDEGAPLLSDVRSKKFELEMINQYINNSNISAIFVMNGLTIGTDTPRVVPLDAYRLYNRIGRDRRYEYDPSSKKVCTYLDSQKMSCGLANTTGDRLEPVSLDQNFPMLFESHLIDFLDAAGCSNIFQYRCTNENVIRSKENGELLFSSSDKLKNSPLRRSFDQTVVNTRDIKQVNEVSGYVDYTDMVPILQDFRFERCSIPRDFSECPEEFKIIEVWKNVVVDVEFGTSVLTTGEVNFPLLRSLANIDANGTSDLGFPTYPSHLGRMAEDAGLTVDYGRVVDGDVFFNFTGGTKLPFPVPLLGSIYELYSLDKTIEKLTQRQYTNLHKSFAIDANFDSFLFNSTTATSRIEALIKSISTGFGIDIDYPLETQTYTSKALRIFEVDHTESNIGLKDYPANGLTTLNHVQTNEVNLGDGEPTKKVVADPSKNIVQFDASEVTSGEGSLNVQSETEMNLGKVRLSDFARAPIEPLAGILGSSIKWSIEILYNGADCENPNIPAAEHTINGVPQVHSGELPAFQMGQLGAVIACYDKVKRILSPDHEIKVAGDPNQVGSLGYVVLPPLDENPNHQEFHGFKRAKFKGNAVAGVPGAMNILRTAWTFSNRIRQEFLDQVNEENLGVDMNLCHPMELDTKITTYNKFYAVTSKVAGVYVKPMKLDDVKSLPGAGDDSHLYCANVKNEARSGYRRPLVQLPDDGTQIASATAIAPWMGTANAIFEDIAKRGFNLNTAENLKLSKECELIENQHKQECLKVPRCGTEESKLAVACLCKKDEPQYMGLEIYMCQRGMLEYSEMVDYGLINRKFDPVKEPEKFNPQGCLFSEVPVNSSTKPPAVFTNTKGDVFMGVYGWRRFMSTGNQGKMDLVNRFRSSYANLTGKSVNEIVGVLNPNIMVLHAGNLNACPATGLSVSTIRELAALAAQNNSIVMLDIQRAGCTRDKIKEVMKNYYVANNITFDFDLEWVSGRITVEELNDYVNYYYTTLGGQVPFVGTYYFAPVEKYMVGSFTSAHPNLAPINDGIGSCGAKQWGIDTMIAKFAKSGGIWGGMDFNIEGYDSCTPSQLIPAIISKGGKIIMSQQ